MKSNTHSLLKMKVPAILSILLGILFAFSFPACQWVDDNRDTIIFIKQNDSRQSDKVVPFKDPVLYWGHLMFTGDAGKPVKETITIRGADLVNFEPCVHLKIKARENRISRGNMPLIRIDDKQVVFPDDFITRDSLITKEICGKSKDFTLEVQHQGEQGNYLEIWIEGMMKNPVTDTRDGNTYPWVKIGSQIWMAKNLAYLPAVHHPSDSSRIIGRYYVYGYPGTDITEAKSTVNYLTYGVLYNFPAALSACPPGWHLPDLYEWWALWDTLVARGQNYDGTFTGTKIARALASKIYWETSSVEGSPGFDPESNNSSGFSGLPAGSLMSKDFYLLGKKASWWSVTVPERDGPNFRYIGLIQYNTNFCYRAVLNYTDAGLSVRCLRN